MQHVFGIGAVEGLSGAVTQRDFGIGAVEGLSGAVVQRDFEIWTGQWNVYNVVFTSHERVVRIFTSKETRFLI